MLDCNSYQGVLQAESTGTHSHEEHQLLMVTEGLMLLQDLHNRHVLSGPNAAFIPQGWSHQAETMGPRVAFRSLYFQSSSFTDLTGQALSQLPQDIVVFQISPLFSQLLQKLCEKPEQSLQTEPYHTTLKLCYLLFLEEKKHRLPVSVPQSQEPKLRPMLKFVNENYTKAISPADLEQHFYMSRRTVQRLFQKELGMTFSAYLRLRRIFEATIRLSTTHDDILTIAWDVGYESISSFYHAFSEIVGLTPKQYRHTHGRSDMSR